ncbi:outer membrane receptor protein involved in Fe transport [Pontibacter ummariensis]|uniref:Outer membrane receptor proteins, mostly Fe transport n=1 Tax=Pontibacter ummariensis TaxID=1610492 RepID=A0A239IQA4_9BACT|nr:TonB-dependent receptor [Pontibacter ummariensis]PRY09698.1 outer membrane receptor protein involved in Fe transport [Pontibacter ummariensis]SNS95735.1 Outer membrane receptor proteins, mostly Fe transport [Pontibacter ummariensis]
MKKNLLIILLGLSTTAVLAQAPQARPQQAQTAQPGTLAPKGNARVSGVVVDADTKQPIEFATIALINPGTGKPIDGTMADEKGRFTLQKVAAGKYTLNVSFLGYQLKAVENVAVTSDNAEVNVGTVSLATDTKKLSEVVITGEKPLVEEKIDRTVYNAEKDITNTGGNAADVLQKVPALSVDTDGNVQLRGSANVRVLINNKPSSIMAGSVADALKQIPADMIKSVEVITSPSAKYDAEGTAGIINIITKKDGGLEGVSGSISATGGTRSSNGNGSVNVRRGKFGVNASASTVQFYNHGDMSNVTISPKYGQEAASRRIREQFGDTRMRGGFMNAQLGFDYEITPKNSLSGSIRRNAGQFNMENSQRQLVTEGGMEQVDESFLTDIKNRNKRQGTDMNLDFVHTFEKPGQELAILSQYTISDADTRNYQDRYYQGEGPFYLQRNNNDGGNNEFTFQADYVHPFENKTTLEIGAKSIFRDVSSDGIYRDVFGDREETEREEFVYNQDVYASYLTYGFAIQKKLNVKLGGRFEQTEIGADLITAGQAFSDSYSNFIPSVAFSYTLKEKHTLKANFTQRIQRPSLFFLNPFDQEQAPGTVVRGNPNLDAELTNLYELGYSTFFKTTSISSSLYMRQTDNAIETVPQMEGNTTVLTFANVAVNKTYGISLFGSVKPVNAWTIGGSSNIYFVDLESSQYQNSGWMYNINMNSSYNFGKGFSAQFNGGFNSRRVQLQGSFAAFSYHTLAFKKELFEGKGGISLGLDNPFRESMKMKNDVNAIDYEQHIRINNYNRGARVSFDYRFGKMEKSKPRRKRSIRNDDTKQGDGNGAGGVQ